MFGKNQTFYVMMEMSFKLCAQSCIEAAERAFLISQDKILFYRNTSSVWIHIHLDLTKVNNHGAPEQNL